MFVQLRLIRLGHEGRDEAAFFNHAIRTRQRVFAHRIEHHIDIFRDLFEFLRGVIDRHICPQLFEQALIRSRGRRNHFCASRFCNLNRHAAHAAGAAVNENRLAGAQLRCVDQRLPRRQRDQRHGSRLYIIERLRFYGRLSFIRHRILRIAAAPHRVGVNCIAHFQFADLRSGFFHNSGDVITGHQWQRCSKKFRILARTNHRVDRVHSRPDHSHQDFVLFRLRPRHFFKL